MRAPATDRERPLPGTCKLACLLCRILVDYATNLKHGVEKHFSLKISAKTISAKQVLRRYQCTPRFHA